MNLLLDTHILLWALNDDSRLSEAHRDLIVDPRTRVFYSSVSIAEISIKAALGKLDAPEGMADYARQSGMESLGFVDEHAEELRYLPWHHRDPFDRMLVAQAKVEELAFATVDPRFAEYEGIRIV
ncbi:type II toxin-antitoxin system VapC family toxin [Actinomycetaceae bacterium MB13-C1-2]|nr:type II toxin-antitoxin system VapC family toxin [Actinomycetaceae bacterium MB13-C1-2]